MPSHVPPVPRHWPFSGGCLTLGTTGILALDNTSGCFGCLGGTRRAMALVQDVAESLALGRF
jgi:hypothetical protein